MKKMLSVFSIVICILLGSCSFQKPSALASWEPLPGMLSVQDMLDLADCPTQTSFDNKVRKWQFRFDRSEKFSDTVTIIRYVKNFKFGGSPKQEILIFLVHPNKKKFMYVTDKRFIGDFLINMEEKLKSAGYSKNSVTGGWSLQNSDRTIFLSEGKSSTDFEVVIDN